MPLFEVAILEKSKKKGGAEKLVFGPKPIIAKDLQAAVIAPFVDGDKIKVDRDRMVVLVRPFH